MHDDELNKAKEKMKQVAVECIALLQERRPIEAATCYLGLVEQVMYDFGVPPAQIQYAAMSPKIDKDGSYKEINVVPSVDLSAIVNDVSSGQQEAALSFARKSFDRVDKCVSLWAMLPDAGDDLDEETKLQIGDAFKLAIGAVSLVRQFGYHFNPRTRGPKPCELADLDQLLIECDKTGAAAAMCDNPALRSLMDFVMCDDAYDEEEEE